MRAVKSCPENGLTHKAVALFVSRVIWGDRSENRFDKYTTVGVVNGSGHLVGGVVYHDYDINNDTMHMSWGSTSKNWLNRDIIHFLISWPFDTTSVQMLIAQTAEDNEPVLKLADGLDFDRHYIPRLFGKSKSGYLLTMTDDKWRQGRFYKGRVVTNG